MTGEFSEPYFNINTVLLKYKVTVSYQDGGNTFPTDAEYYIETAPGVCNKFSTR